MFNIQHSFDHHFVELLDRLEKKYGEEMFELEGIDRKNLDIAKFTNKFLETKVTADVSVDANANVDDTSVLSWDYEMPKPLMKLNGLYFLWKDALKKYGIKRANKMIELEISGGIRIHDLHGWLKPYSYYRETPIYIRVNGCNVKCVTMKQLFDMYAEQKQVFPDREVIDLTNVKKYIGYENIQIKHKSVIKHTYDSKNTSNAKIFEKHNIEILDGNGKWTKLQQVLRHKRDTNMVAYQLENGDYSVVTTNHPVILADGTEILAEKLQVGMEVKSGNKEIFKDIAIEYIDVPTDFAYFIGFITGDGNVGRHKFNSNNNNLMDNDLCINVTEYEGGITIYQKNIKTTKIYDCVNNLLNREDDLIRKSVKRDGNRISFNNRTIRTLLAKYFGIDYTNNSATKNIPINILSWTKEAKSAFIAGLIDAEGSVGSIGTVDLRMKAHAVMNMLQEVLMSIGISSIKRFTGKTFENFYGIGFQADELIKSFSTKLSNIEIGEKNKDPYSRTYKVKKVDIFNPDTDIHLGYNLSEEDSEFYYVYDITTESHTFYSGGMTQHNCWGTSLSTIVNEGMPWVKRIKIGPIKHFYSFINNTFQLICTLSTQCVGAVAVPDFLIYAEYFIRKDFGDKWYEDEKTVGFVRQAFQHFIYSVNNSFRGNQSPFTNVSVYDKHWLKALFKDHMNPDFTHPDLENAMRVQKLFVDELMNQLQDNPFTFPVMTAASLLDPETREFKDQEWLDWLAEVSVKNKCLNLFQDDSTSSISSCCRLKNELSTVGKDGKQEYVNSFGVGGISIGSHRVVCLNIPQIAYIAKYSEKDTLTSFFNIIESRIKISQDILDIHKELLERLIKNGNLPMYSYGVMNLNKQYSTLGFIGLYEALEILGYDIRTPEGLELGKKILGVFNKLNAERTAKDGRIRNLEQIPGETAAVTFALKDKLQFANAGDYDLYANQYLPLIKEALLTDRIRLQGEFDSDTSGGAILHADFDSDLTKEQIKNILNAFAKAGVIYGAIDDCQIQCHNCGKVYTGSPNTTTSKCCNSKNIEIWMRVVGFKTPKRAYNKIRRTKDLPRRFCYEDGPMAG